MTDFPFQVGLFVALALGAASPGPSFVMVARTSISASRPDGLAAALGMGVGGMVYAAAALLGLNGLILAVPLLYLAIKISGGCYLAYLGIKIWRSAKQVLDFGGQSFRNAANPGKSFALGLTTQLSNPKTAIAYASIFGAFMPQVPSIQFTVTTVSIVFLIETGWYSLVALGLSSDRPRRVYLCSKAWIDRVAGSVMIGLGLTLILSARRS